MCDIVDGLIKISTTNSKNRIWELGSGKNFSINEVFELFKNKFNSKCEYVNDQKGNYKETLRENNKALDELNWKPKGDLKKYINDL